MSRTAPFFTISSYFVGIKLRAFSAEKQIAWFNIIGLVGYAGYTQITLGIEVSVYHYITDAFHYVADVQVDHLSKQNFNTENVS